MSSNELAPQFVFGQAAAVFDDLDVALSTRIEYKWQCRLLKGSDRGTHKRTLHPNSLGDASPRGAR